MFIRDLVCSFLMLSFLWFWYQGNKGFIGLVGNVPLLFFGSFCEGVVLIFRCLVNFTSEAI